MPDAARLYQEGGFTPEMGNVLDNYLNTLQSRQEFYITVARQGKRDSRVFA